MICARNGNRRTSHQRRRGDQCASVLTLGNKMIYARLSVFSMYTAFVTAVNEETFLDEFRNVVLSALGQYEDYFCTIGKERKDIIEKELAALSPVPIGELLSLSYDLKIDGDGCSGIVAVEEVFTRKEDVERQYQQWVDDVNKDIVEEEEKWAVFGGGFFPDGQGFEIDELFK